MSLIDLFRSSRPQTGSAALAKERLQIIVAHERGHKRSPNYLPALKEEIINVVRKYVNVDHEHVQLKRDRAGDYEVLELNIVLPDDNDGPRKRF